jgi:holin-like protein
MKFLIYLPLFIAFQLFGNWLKEALALPVPGATLGMFMLLLCLFIIPKNTHINESAQKLLQHLPLFFIPAGVGIMSFGKVIKEDSLAFTVSVFGSTIVCFILAALFTQRLLKDESDAETELNQKREVTE